MRDREGEKLRFVAMEPLSRDEIMDLLKWATDRAKLSGQGDERKGRARIYANLSWQEAMMVRYLIKGRDYGDGVQRPNSPVLGMLAQVVSETRP